MNTINQGYKCLFFVVLLGCAALKGISQIAFTPNNYYINTLTDWTVSSFEWSFSEAPSFISSGTDLNWDFTAITSMTSISLTLQEYNRMSDASTICPEIGSNDENRFVIRSFAVTEPSNYIDNIYSLNSGDLVRIGKGNSPSAGSGCFEFQLPHLILPSSLSYEANFEAFDSQLTNLIKTSYMGFGSYTSNSTSNPIQDVALLMDSVFSYVGDGDTSVIWRWFQNSEGIFIPLASLFSFDSSFGETTYYFNEHQLLSYTLDVKNGARSEAEILHYFANQKLFITCTKERISQLELYDLNGRIIGKHSPNNERFELDSFNLPRVFIAKVHTASGNKQTLKIVQI